MPCISSSRDMTGTNHSTNDVWRVNGTENTDTPSRVQTKVSKKGRTLPGVGKLAVGTRVMFPDRSGRTPKSDLYGTITGSRMGKCSATGQRLPVYVIRYEDGNVEDTPVEDVEAEWQVVQ